MAGVRPGWSVMPETRHFLLALGIATWSAAAAAPHARPSESGSADRLPMTFYVARGPASACGPGCHTWIAAEGKIDLGAAERLRRLLAGLGPRKLPLYLNSPGGSVLGAIDLGRLIRGRDLTVSVARTLPAACRRHEPHARGCDALKRSGETLGADLDASRVMCNSACVLVLAGGARRSVPPGVRLAVHAIGVETGKTSLSRPLIAVATRVANAHIVDFLHDMGAPRALFDAANATPHESSRVLGRDEMVRFGLDTREFAEADWRFREDPFVAIAKSFFLHTGEAGIAYPEALLQLNCSAGKSVHLMFARERPASAIVDTARPARLAVAGQFIDVPYLRRAGSIEIHTTTLPPDALAAAPDDAPLEIWSDGLVPTGTRDPAVVLTMTGFSAAYARLRQACTDTASATAQ